MPKNIVPSPTAAVAVDRLTLNTADARATDQGAAQPSAAGLCWAGSCFSEE